jgi:hypothetical protein
MQPVRSPLSPSGERSRAQPASHPATPLQTWCELLANGSEPGKQGPIFISNAAFAAGALRKHQPIWLDHEWMGKQEGKLRVTQNPPALAGGCLVTDLTHSS